VARELLGEVVSRMGLDLQVQTSVEQDRITLSLDGDGASELIGRKGQTLDALQFLINRMLNRKGFDDHRPVVVDSGGYRERRVEALRELALRLGDKAARTGKTVAVNPMSAHDRRVIHMALREVPGVTTHSEGDGAERRLLIVPED
jgi:spoIIIJ-associated protein